jgi:hypothetical protein
VDSRPLRGGSRRHARPVTAPARPGSAGVDQPVKLAGGRSAS